MNGSNLYRVFLLRLWREDDGYNHAGIGPAPLRISLEDPRSGRRITFSNLELLLDFLAGQIEQKKE